MPVPLAAGIILKSDVVFVLFCFVFHVRRLGFLKPAVTSPTSFLGTRDTGVFMQIHAAKCLLHRFAAVSPAFTTFNQLRD